MQTLDVISVNLWQIVISLSNLVLLFWILRKFLFAPVTEILEKRQKELDDRYAAAETAERQAGENRRNWEDRLSQAEEQADAILQDAAEQAKLRGEKLIAEAREQADGIIRTARDEAELERRKAADGIKQEIVEISGVLAEKLLEREINAEDHRNLIDFCIREMGDGDGGDR